MRPMEILVEVIWGVPTHGALLIDVVGEMILGKPQHRDTLEFLIRTDGWACYKRAGCVIPRRASEFGCDRPRHGPRESRTHTTQHHDRMPKRTHTYV